MFASNLDLCSSGWLEIVFNKRNKEYGAYSLRQEYAGNLVKVMCITFMTVIVALMAGGVLIKYNAARPQLRVTTIELNNYVAPVAPESQKPKYQAANRPELMQKTLLPVFSNKPVIVNDNTINNAPAGPQDVDVPNSSGDEYNDIADAIGNSNGTDAQPEENNDIFTPLTVETKPEPYGGSAAWVSFLQKNLKYPKEAIDVKYHGNVSLSFVVEKSGLITNIVVEKSACTSMDEEAVRILKLSKAWKPGYKDGVAVRVKCPIIFNFIMGS